MPLRSTVATAALVFALTATSSANAQEAPKPALNLTIYANGLALVDARRTLEAGTGRTVRIDGVAERLIADSVRVRLEDGPEVREITLDSDILTHRTLLERALGETVRMIRTDPETGAETVERAEVLSVADGLVLRIGDRIETEAPGRIVFEDVPDDLHATPRLSLGLAGPLIQPTPMRLSYLTGGVSWQAVYTVMLNDGHDRLDLEGWAKIVNESGVDFGPANVALVAGDVNRETPVPEGRILMRAETMAAAAPRDVARREMSAFHLYDLKTPTVLLDRQTKQIRLLGADGVVARRVLEYRRNVPVFGALRGRSEPEAVTQKVIFENDTGARLGIPLPAGVVRAYVRDTDDKVRFVGEDRIANVAVGDAVNLGLGRAFDVTVTRTQSAFRQLGERTVETAFVLSVNNGGSRAAGVDLVEEIPGDWEILEESEVHARDDAAATWTIEVPPRQSVDLVYRVRVRR